MYPEAIEEMDYDNCYPLHYACAHNQSETIIQLLISKYPKAIEQKNCYDCYPLHLACSSHPSIPVIQE